MRRLFPSRLTTGGLILQFRNPISLSSLFTFSIPFSIFTWSYASPLFSFEIFCSFSGEKMGLPVKMNFHILIAFPSLIFTWISILSGSSMGLVVIWTVASGYPLRAYLLMIDFSIFSRVSSNTSMSGRKPVTSMSSSDLMFLLPLNSILCRCMRSVALMTSFALSGPSGRAKTDTFATLPVLHTFTMIA
jgi:hypothetical protein